MALLMTLISVVFWSSCSFADPGGPTASRQSAAQPRLVVSSGIEITPIANSKLSSGNLLLPIILEHPHIQLQSLFTQFMSRIPESRRERIGREGLSPLITASPWSDNMVLIPDEAARRRVKRGINFQRYNPLAYVGWVWSRVIGTTHSFDIEDLKVESDDLSAFVDELRTAVAGNRKAILGLESTVLQSQRATHQFLNKTLTLLNQELSQLSESVTDLQIVTSLHGYMIIALQELTAYNEAKLSCADHILSQDLLPMALLARLIADQEKTLPGHLRLIHDENHVSEYYGIPNCYCLITPSQILLSISLPFTETHHALMLYQVTIIPFSRNNQTCFIEDVLPPAYTTFGNDEVIDVRKDYCIQGTRDLCVYNIQGTLMNPVQKNCLQTIHRGASLTQIRRNCNVRCRDPEYPVLVARINSTSWMLTPQALPALIRFSRTHPGAPLSPWNPSLNLIVTLDCDTTLEFPQWNLSLTSLERWCGTRRDTYTDYTLSLSIWRFNYSHLMIPSGMGFLELKGIDLSSALEEGVIQIEHIFNESQIPEGTVPSIHWTGPTGLSFLSTIVIAVCCILGCLVAATAWKRFGSRKPPAALTAALVPAGLPVAHACDHLPIILADMTSNLISIIFFIVIGCLAYRKIKVLLRKRRCHDLALPLVTLKAPTHLDLVMVLQTNTLTIALSDLPLPKLFYPVSTWAIPVFDIVMGPKSSSVTLEFTENLQTIHGDPVTLPRAFTIPFSVPSQGGHAFYSLQSSDMN